jgi:formylglycine-generating enzyme required for sulfatase activity
MRGILTILACAMLAGVLQGGLARAQEKTFTNDLGLEFVLIPAGSFMMGSGEGYGEGYDNETPAHKVTISQPFYLGAHEVTQEQWEAVTGNNPSLFKGRNNPVEQVSWDDVQDFIRRLNQTETRGKYRLPTEAEWEYASRAGKSGAYFFGDDAGELGRYAWYDEPYDTGTTRPVGEKRPNPWGLYDMYGNVSEWVQDWYGEKYYADSPAADPEGPSVGSHRFDQGGSRSHRVNRGGSWLSGAGYCRSAFRGHDMPDSRGVVSNLGFRLAFSPNQ